MSRNTRKMVLRDPKAGSFSDDRLNVFGNEPPISAHRRPKLHGHTESPHRVGRFDDFPLAARLNKRY